MYLFIPGNACDNVLKLLEKDTENRCVGPWLILPLCSLCCTCDEYKDNNQHIIENYKETLGATLNRKLTETISITFKNMLD